MTDLLVMDPWPIYGNAFPLAECYPGMKMESGALKHLGMVLTLRPANARPVGDAPVLAEIYLNIERPLKFALRVKVGSNHESMIYMYYLNIPFRICNSCFRLGHLVEDCALLNNRELERIYDVNENTEPDVTESQSWEHDFKVLFGDQIEEELVSDARMASPVNISPITVLNREDIFLDAISSGYSHFSTSVNGSEDLVSDTQEIVDNRKRLFSEISPDLANFPPESGLLQVVVNQRLSSNQERPNFNFETADAHYSFSKDLSEEDEEYFTPYRELEIDTSQSAFRMSINSSDPSESISSLGSNSVEIVENAQSKIKIDQFGSLMGSVIIEEWESTFNPVLHETNPNKETIVAASNGDAENIKKGIQ
ncbi:hypothetical protein MKX03_017373, partial [Papaver bracteatum]